ncbi:unnamed protein product, partial [Phaeothamnion confervicola]
GGGNSGGRVVNPTECQVVELLVWALHRSGVCGREIGVITPFRAQLRLLEATLRRRFPLVEVNTIDKYQGRDKHIVIVSFVRSNAAGLVGELLRDWRRLNVALSRAKAKLLLVGSAGTLRNAAVLGAMVAALEKRRWVYRLPLGATAMYGREWQLSQTPLSSQQPSQQQQQQQHEREQQMVQLPGA